MDAVCNTFQV